MAIPAFTAFSERESWAMTGHNRRWSDSRYRRFYTIGDIAVAALFTLLVLGVGVVIGVAVR